METRERLKEAILEAQAEAALGGHDLAPFELVDTLSGGYQARCRRCNQTTWVGKNGLRYSLLADVCPGSTSE